MSYTTKVKKNKPPTSGGGNNLLKKRAGTSASIANYGGGEGSNKVPKTEAG
jgi:hypothetical protein